MKFDFDRIVDRKNTNCCKYDLAVEHGKPADALPLWVADMDFPAPPCVEEAMIRAVKHGIYGYPVARDGYYNAVCGWFRRRFGWNVQKEWICQSPGVVFALAAAVRIMTQPGDAILIHTPVYSPFYSVVRRNDRKLVESELIYEDRGYRIDFADMERKIVEEQVKLLILCSPHNPAGRVWTREELRQMGALCRKYGVKVISDEIHCDFAFAEYPHTPFLLACPEMAEDAMVCTAPSKTFNLAGLQTSNIFIPDEKLRKAFGEEMDRVFFETANCLGLVACQAAYEEGEEWLDACKEYLRANYEYVCDFLAKNIPGIRPVKAQGTYFAWIDCSGLGLSKEQLDDLMANKAKLWLISGTAFGRNADQFQRVVLACPRSTLEQAMAQLKAAVDNL